MLYRASPTHWICWTKSELGRRLTERVIYSSWSPRYPGLSPQLNCFCHILMAVFLQKSRLWLMNGKKTIYSAHMYQGQMKWHLVAIWIGPLICSVLFHFGVASLMPLRAPSVVSSISSVTRSILGMSQDFSLLLMTIIISSNILLFFPSPQSSF